MSVTAAGVVLAAAVLDRLVGEPPARLHPVVWFGRLVGPLDREWASPKVVGTLAAAGLPMLAAGVVAAAVWLAGSVHPVMGAGVAALVLFSTTSLRLLTDTACEVIGLSESDLTRAREELLALAGRDASELSPELVRSAAAESAAENLSDGFVASLSAFGLVALWLSWNAWPTAILLSLGAAAAAWVKAVNTMDSMVGYRSKPVGSASAILDDLVMRLPARLTAVVISAAAGSPDPLLTGRRWARVPASPNAGWPMAALAAALHVRLEKPGNYSLNPVAELPTVAEAERGVGIVRRAGWLAVGAWAVILVG